MALTLIMENQYSTFPNSFTAAALTPRIAMEKTTVVSQRGISGHQNLTKIPAAITSPPMAMH